MRLAGICGLLIVAWSLSAQADGLQPPAIDLQPEIPTTDLDTQAPDLGEPEFDDVEDPSHRMPRPFQACASSREELERVRARALEFLFEQHPQLNQECERLKSGITFATEDQVCFVESGRIRDEACRNQAKNSYIITISVQTLEPMEVLWIRQDRYIPEYQGDLEEYSNMPRE